MKLISIDGLMTDGSRLAVMFILGNFTGASVDMISVLVLNLEDCCSCICIYYKFDIHMLVGLHLPHAARVKASG